jgi:hypothetical protein
VGEADGIVDLEATVGVVMKEPCPECVAAVVAALIDRQATRIRVGLLKARLHGTKSGKAIGRPRCNHEGQISRIVDLRDRGLSWREISSELGLSSSTIRRLYAEAVYQERPMLSGKRKAMQTQLRHAKKMLVRVQQFLAEQKSNSID